MRRELARAAAAALLSLAAVVFASVPNAAGATSAGATLAAAISRTAAAGTPGSAPVVTGSVVRFNVGATHSPELERQLAGHASGAPSSLRGRPAALPAAASVLQGIDVASFQHPDGAPINWSAVAAGGYKFAFIKATEGSYYVNPYYRSDLAGAESAGLFVAPYAFAIPNYSGGTLQADYLIDSARYASGGTMLPPILDIEYDPYAGNDGTPAGSWCYGMSTSAMASWISAFVTEVQRRIGLPPVIYTTAQWWNKCTGGSGQFAADPLWLADYPADPASLLPGGPPTPTGWSSWQYWQYTSSATLPSATSATFDASYLSSSALELAVPASPSESERATATLRLNALNGVPAATTFSASRLPAGLSVDASSGVISGTLPASPGAFPVAVTATAGSTSVTRTFTWRVHASARLGRLVTRAGIVGSPVRYQVPAFDGLRGCSLHFTSSRLPPGLTMTACGMIAGWPSRVGTTRVTVRISDSSGATLRQGSFTWKIGGASARGPAGHLRLRRDGRCLTARSASDIAIEPCKPVGSERWTVAADGTIRIDGACLSAKPVRGTAAAALDVVSCRRGGQRWQLQSDGVLSNLADGRCLADTGVANGARAVAAVCLATPDAVGNASTPSNSQQWTLPAGPLVSGIPAFCASDQGGRGDPAGAVTLRRCQASAPQSWTFGPDGTIRAGGKCLSTVGGSLAPEADLQLTRCIVGAPRQHWQLAEGPIGVQLRSPLAGLCAGDPRESSRPGTLLVLEPCVLGDAGATWRVS